MMRSSHKKLLGLAILLLFLVPLCLAVKKVYRELRQPELNAALIAAVKKNDTTKVIALFLEGADPNAKDLPPDSRSMWMRLWDIMRRKRHLDGKAPTVLFIALSKTTTHPFPAMDAPPANISLVKAIVDSGGTINCADEIGMTPLMWAASTTSRETVRLLLERGAQINATDKYGNTALLYAVQRYVSSDPALVTLLLHSGAHVNARELSTGETALHQACNAGDVDILRLLLDAGGDTEAHDNNGWTPLMVAVYQAHADCVRLLLTRGAHVNARDDTGASVLSFSDHFYDEEVIKMLKKAGAKE